MDNLLHFTNNSLTNIEGEIWVPAYGYEGTYEVSNKGRIKSLNRIVSKTNGRYQTFPEHIIKQCKVIHPFNQSLKLNTYSLYVRLATGMIDPQKKQKTYKNVTVASLILNSFKRPDKYNNCTHHLNCCSYDNRLENLTFEDIKTKRRIEYDLGIRNGQITTAHLKDRIKELTKNFNNIRGHYSNKGKRFERRKKCPVTVYFKRSKSIASYTCIRNASEQLGIKEYTLRNAMNSNSQNKRNGLYVKRGIFNLYQFQRQE